MLAETTRERILITVKTYPHPSQRHGEVACTAGVTEEGQWVRLYPVNFRNLPPDKKFQKYQWIEVDLEPGGQSGDKRPESRRPHLDTLEIASTQLSTSDAWRERREIIDQLPVRTMKEWRELYENERVSLGVVRPTKVLDVKISPTTDQWDGDIVKQIDLFAPHLRELSKIPFDFHYVFNCEDSDKPHRALITDWELGELYRNEERRLGDRTHAAESVREKFLNELCGPGKDTRFFVGTTFPYNSWIVIGVFWPPRTTQTFLDLETGA